MIHKLHWARTDTRNALENACFSYFWPSSPHPLSSILSLHISSLIQTHTLFSHSLILSFISFISFVSPSTHQHSLYNIPLKLESIQWQQTYIPPYFLPPVSRPCVLRASNCWGKYSVVIVSPLIISFAASFVPRPAFRRVLETPFPGPHRGPCCALVSHLKLPRSSPDCPPLFVWFWPSLVICLDRIRRTPGPRRFRPRCVVSYFGTSAASHHHKNNPIAAISLPPRSLSPISIGLQVRVNVDREWPAFLPCHPSSLLPIIQHSKDDGEHSA
ncbi:hypothetical protein BJX96DRAFT_121445 [Aspergillus floccosus]